MDDPTIRKASLSDAALLTSLAAKTFWDAFHDHTKNAPDDLKAYMDEAFSLEQVSSEIADENAIFLLLEIDGDAAGYAKLKLHSIEDPIIAEKPIELCRLYSKQEYIGKGIGKALMDECMKIARDEDCDLIWLGVWEYNPRARRFYEKYGFEQIGEHVFQLGSDPQTDHLMQKKI